MYSFTFGSKGKGDIVKMKMVVIYINLILVNIL